MIRAALTPLSAYQFAQWVAHREIQLFGTRALSSAQRTTNGWWTPIFPSIFLCAPRAKRRG